MMRLRSTGRLRETFSNPPWALQNIVAAEPRSEGRETTMEEFKKFVQIIEGD